MNFDINDIDIETLSFDEENSTNGVEQLSFDLYSANLIDMFLIEIKLANKTIPVYITTDKNIASQFHKISGHVDKFSLKSNYYLLPDGLPVCNEELLGKLITLFSLKDVKKSERNLFSDEREISELFETNYIKKQLLTGKY